MPCIAHILLPTDFSPRAAIVARHAAALADAFQSRITMLHVLPPMNPAWCLEGYTALMDEVIEHQKIQTRQRLDTFLEPELRDFDIERVLAEGDPATAIVEYANSSGVDLIMMPTRGCGPFRRFIVGSVTAKVLHDTHCAVWTSEHIEEIHSRHPGAPKTVVCAVDLAPEAGAVLLWAAETAANLQARLVVAHAIPSLEFNPETYYLEADMRRSLIGDAQAKIRKMLDGSLMPNAGIRVVGGSIPKVVRSIAEDSEADLLIIGRAATTGMLGRLRTHSYAIIRESPCPVISI